MKKQKRKVDCYNATQEVFYAVLFGLAAVVLITAMVELGSVV